MYNDCAKAEKRLKWLTVREEEHHKNNNEITKEVTTLYKIAKRLEWIDETVDRKQEWQIWSKTSNITNDDWSLGPKCQFAKRKCNCKWKQ